MKIVLFALGILVSSIAMIIDAEERVKAANIGYFLLAAAMFMGAALWRSDSITKKDYIAIQKVYAILAAGDMDMDALMEKLQGKCSDMGTYEHYQSVVGQMLSRRMIIIKGGLVSIGEGIDATA